jgi:Protein of unknown function (DUF664)
MDTERTALTDELATARAALIATTTGLTDTQAGERPTASALSLGGLVKHVSFIEEGWQRFVLDGSLSYPLPAGVTWADLAGGTAREYPRWAIDHQNSFQMLPGETLAGIVKQYEEVGARTAEIVATVPDMSATRPLPEAPWNPPGAVRSVRQVWMHMISETAQHAGHADILRESLDGHTAG